MTYHLKQIEVLSDQAPPQYAVGEQCRECGRPLSRYNRYVVCGPCRVRLSTAMSKADIEHADDVEAAGFSWERWPKREPVRRGPLLVPDERAE